MRNLNLTHLRESEGLIKFGQVVLCTDANATNTELFIATLN